MKRASKSRGERYRGFREFLNEFKRSKAGLIGLIMILGFALISAYATVRYPYSEVTKWNDPRNWIGNPTSVAPAWIQTIIGQALPENAVLIASERAKSNLTYRGTTFILTTVEQLLSFRYEFAATPTNLIISLTAQYSENSPSVSLTWMKPDGTTIEISSYLMERGIGEPPYYNITKNIYPVNDADVKKNLAAFLKTSFNQTVDFANVKSLEVLFGTNQSIAGQESFQVLQGIYRLKLRFQSFNLASGFPNDTLPIDDIKQLKLALVGRVYGSMGTDWLGRDLFIGILWGAPVALLVGILTSVISVAIGVFLGIFSGFYGGRVDSVVQRITDYFLILPFLPLLVFLSYILRGTITYSIWILVLLLSIFGWPTITKVVRSLALQIRESGYVEAARALGASNFRILLRHVLPQTLPYAFANIALSVPGFIFAEASLSFLGLGDPILPTWGKILGDAQRQGAAVGGYWWWVLIPGFCIILVAMSFALLGNALDRILTPKLRKR